MRISCGDDATPCRCDPVTGCGHLSSWRIVRERWVSRCMVPECDCSVMDVCDCVMPCDSTGGTEAFELERVLGMVRL